MSGGFLVWRPGPVTDGICKLRGLRGVEDSFELAEGVSRLEGWPEDAHAVMSDEYPKDIALADSLHGTGSVLVSGKAKAVLEEAGVQRVEFLPVRIVNHKGRTASTDYFIVNPLDILDVMDVDASGGKWNKLDPESLYGCKQLVLREPDVPADRQIFRLKPWKDVVVIRRELADRMRAAGLTGLKLIEPAKYKGLT